MKHPVGELLDWLGESLDPPRRDLLNNYALWLVEEAMGAGGIGPAEGKRIESRHIAESLSFGCLLPHTALKVLDIGSGVGLPGIPLAILRPESHFVLLDRSRRRCDLSGRSIRLLGLSNVEVVCEDASFHAHTYDAITMRAALPIDNGLPLLKQILRSNGVAVVGWKAVDSGVTPDARRRVVELAEEQSLVVEFKEVPVLDSPTVLLRITTT